MWVFLFTCKISINLDFFSKMAIMACVLFFFFFNDTATTEIYTLSLHDALPICFFMIANCNVCPICSPKNARKSRSEEHTSELQSPCNLVCRLLLEKKKSTDTTASQTYRFLTYFVDLIRSYQQTPHTTLPHHTYT